MEICTGQRYESVHPKPGTGSYEWWYFDGWDARTRTGFVLILYEGNPFSSRYLNALRKGKAPSAATFPAMSLSVYHRGKPVYYTFDEWSPDQVSLQPPDTIRMPGCQCTFRESGGNWIYHLELDHRMVNGDSIRGSIQFKSNPFDALLDKQIPVSPSSIPVGNHRWNLIVPDADVSGDLSIGGYKPLELGLSGRGYHDHNIGLEPMAETFDQWYWGRFHLPDRTLIFYLMEENRRWNQRAWLLSDSRAVPISGGTWTLEDPSSNWFGLQSNRRIGYEEKDRSLQIDQQIRLDDGPFYQRYASKLLLREGDVLTRGEGICEMILPARIEQRRYRPLVDMRIRYPDRNPHWVQQSARLYRWTW